MKVRKLEWKKCPAVTTGGKSYFWTLRLSDIRYWVSWDRVYRAWVIEDSCGAVWGKFKNAAAGRAAVEQHVS